MFRSKKFGYATRSRRDIQESSKLPFFGDIFGLKSVWQLKKTSFPIKLKVGVDSPEDARRQSISVAPPSSSPISRYDPKTIPIHFKQVVMRTSGVTAMPSSILRVSIWILTSYLNHVCKQTERLPQFSFYFSDKLWSLLFFFVSLCRAISLEQKNKIQLGRLSICCLVHNARSSTCFPVWDLYYAGPARPLSAAGGQLDDLDRDLSVRGVGLFGLNSTAPKHDS